MERRREVETSRRWRRRREVETSRRWRRRMERRRR